MIFSSLVLSLIASQVVSQEANCVSGRIYFNAERVVNLPTPLAEEVTPLDPSKYDLTIDWGSENTMVYILKDVVNLQKNCLLLHLVISASGHPTDTL